ncbi:hypothetical protein K490DRAFT_72049 [Saccharata proteae CBS 121410]|uniref:Amidohydrolase-related domain-containing protein n=1 Tax=Saccharata proteae CBS 121410 TaxID=1314787 RepID=A0A6A5YBW6_9PEZI|nr:hypothetical protein K490DRAFT_72049 [Saccharata proteae CBS 121410]
MPSLLITDVRIHTGTAVIERGWVHVVDNEIRSVGSSADAPPASNESTTVLSRPNHTLLPGLLDSHVHATSPVAVEQSIRFGVTTVLDMHNEPDAINALVTRAGSTNQVADVKSAFLAATVKGGWPEAVVTAHDASEETLRKISTWPNIRTASDASKFVTDNASQGASYIKLMQESGTGLVFPPIPTPPPSIQRALVAAAHAHNLPAVGHALCLPDTLVLLDAGVDGLTHTFFDQRPTEEVVEAYVRTGAWCCPTLVAVGSLTGEGAEGARRLAGDGRVRGRLEGAQRENLGRCMGFAGEGGRFEFAVESVRELRRRGVRVIAGSDAAGPALGTAWGLSLHHELALFVQHCGFTPFDAINAATALPASCFGFEDRGRIEPGLKADLMLVEGNALEDVGRLLDLRGVWRGGEILQATWRCGC